MSTTWLPLAGTQQKAWILHIATHGFSMVDKAPTSGGAKAGATAATSPPAKTRCNAAAWYSPAPSGPLPIASMTAS